jgi:hypothetical protein
VFDLRQEASDLLEAFPSDSWSRISWGEGSKGKRAKKFLRVRVYGVGYRGKHVPRTRWLIGQRPRRVTAETQFLFPLGP